MYLKSIEVQGFKSFANKILFEFHDGITGIVGPNGSGKSNVADAVRWVLGEQSAKQLRGSRMEDVIFAGTQMRKPQGYAYVAITLDNSDHQLPIEYDEVTVARRVYRSGESEYLLNGTNCRLRDVQELFLDTGIGKEGYSIIGQGQIDKILSGKPEERRELFDEAAGIVKYKKRKAAAEKQLEEEKLNLSRITDILSEIEKQIGPLEKQQTAAKEYLRLKDELKQVEVNAFLLEQEKQEEAERELEEKLSIVQNDFNEASAEYESSKELYERLEQETETLAGLLAENTTRRNELQLDIQQKESDIKLLQEQISTIRVSESHYKERMSVVEREREEKYAELTRYKNEKLDVDRKLYQLEDAKEEADRELEEIRERMNGYTNEIENRNADVFRLLSENGTIKTNVQRYRTIKEQNQIKKAALTQKVLKNQTDQSVAESAVEEGRKRLEEISEKISGRLTKNRADDAELIKIREELNRIRETYEQTQRECIREQSRAESLRNLSERYDGYSGGIRRVMEQKEKEAGIIGVVADIFEVEKKYETAIETALGGNIQNIVTDTEATAKHMVQFLKENKAGRATFLPLDAVKERNGGASEEVRREQGVIGYASELVSTEDRFQSVISFLLGRIVVVDTIDHALSLAKKYRYSLRIVTLEGEQLNPGGSISGGAYKNASNLLGRRREVEEAQKRVEDFGERLASMEERRNTLRALREEIGKRLEESKAALQEEFLLQNTAKLELDRIEAEAKEHSSSYDEIHKELLEIEAQERELTENIATMEQALEENIADSEHNESCIEECTKQLAAERQLEQSAMEKGESLRMELSTVQQSNHYLAENISRIEAEIAKLTGEESKLTDEGAGAGDAVSEKEAGIVRKKQEIESLYQLCESMEKEAADITRRREEANGKHKSLLTKRESLSERKSELDKELFRLNDKKEKLKEQIEAQCAYMWDEYEMTLSDAAELKTEEEVTLPQAKKKVQELKNKIKSLGSVNVNAIEEYRECMERFTFLDAQKTDLVTAGETLTAMISELDGKMREQFEEKFAQIKEQFDVVFRELFGGGKGTLDLQEEEDILTAGVRINAQPPGKKLQNMMQLSGGEKALTAIALLFAIQNLKPSPFCLLDEIEAALDDSNVKRYAGYLHKLTKHTQFIVITHRRGTMAAADTLYGITMQEKGVSTLVSVNLIEDKLDA
ncbi:MAG: chromosome segregation protein SMC [Lachnospiraceae bacterium]|nr:chromosome segregation protein SMC [Lachnospiraceae bacterium]